MEKNKVLFLSYWYPNKISRIFPVFVKKHAHAIALKNELTVLSLSIIKGDHLYKKTYEVIFDEQNIETHQIYIESKVYKVLYLLLPLHYFILKSYILKNLLGKRDFTIIHSNILFPCAVVGSALAKKLHLKHVITEHWSRLDSFFKENFYSRYGKRAYNKASAITCVSELLRDNIKKYTSNPRVIVVPNVVDSQEYFIDKNIQKSGKLRFVAAANWTPPKNPFYFLDALQQLAKEKALPDFEVCLIGNGAQLDAVKKRNYPFVIFYTGILNAKQLKEELNKSHIFLHGSEFETFSTIIAEALMCGLPSVVSPVGIAREVINANNGFVTNNTVSDFREKILLCYKNSYDDSKISAQLGGRYDPDFIGDLFNKVYQGL